MPAITGDLELPQWQVSGYFESPRPSYNEFAPTREQVYQMFMKLMPEGRAYNTHDSSIPRESSNIRKFWYALADEMQRLEQYMVRMLDEAFCIYARDDIDGWFVDVLAEENEPFGSDVCAKAGRVGDLSIEDYRSIAERAGWILRTLQFFKGDADIDGYAGVYSTLYIKVDLDASPVVPDEDVLGTTFRLGLSRLGEANTTEQIALLTALYDRAVPAHVAIVVETV